jgi:hypothetical protein
MKINYFILFCILYLNPILGIDFCPAKVPSPPQTIKVNTSYTVRPVFKNKKLNIINIKNRVFIKESPDMGTGGTVYSYYSSSDYCPPDFEIPTKEFYQSLISALGTSAYSTLTKKTGLNMSESFYYLTRNKTKTAPFSFIFLHFKNGKVLLEDLDATKIGYGTKIRIKCALFPPASNLVFPDYEGDIKLNVATNIKTDGKYFNGYLWRIGSKIYNTTKIKHKFTKSGVQRVEFWGKLLTGETYYLCNMVYVKKKEVSSTQTFSESQIKSIKTNFSMKYVSSLHFSHSNAPVAPRINGGYYVAVTDQFKYLHILSFNKNDKLIKDFNTTDLAYPQDITETDYGFVYYAVEADSGYHSYLKLYNKNFVLINTVEIMNNKKTDDKTIDSTLKKQVIKYDSSGKPVFGMRFMYSPDNGKLIYSSGIVFLIFCHYNYFTDSGGHTGDTVVTFNDLLKDMNFGETWGASHSLIQSVTYNNDYFFTAALSDAYPQGIKVQHTSKKEFYSSYDPVNKKKNTRLNGANSTLAGKITGYQNGSADGKLGGLIFFEKLGIFCLVYAKTPNPEGANKGKNVIYAATFVFNKNKTYSLTKTKEVKIFETDNVMNVRAGKYGDNMLFITYFETTRTGGQGYGNVPKGSVPKVFLFRLPAFTALRQDKLINTLLMNTNEDLRTFADGVLIWATSNTDGKLVINKIGTPKLNDTYDDITYKLTKNDVTNYDNLYKLTIVNLNQPNVSSSGVKVKIASISAILMLAIVIAFIYSKHKNSKEIIGLETCNGELLYKN